VLKAYAVFNADQCDGLPAFYHPKPLVAALEPEGREDRLDAFFAHIGADLRHHGAQAYYEPLRDRVSNGEAIFERSRSACDTGS
jgi:antirestriction protein ArdC